MNWLALIVPSVALVLSPLNAAAETAREAPRAVPRTSTVTYFDVSPPLRQLATSATATPWESRLAPELGADPSSVVESHEEDAALSPATEINGMPAPLLNFDALSSAYGTTPPSPSADVGPNHYVVMSNVRMRIFDKSGASLLGPIDNNVIWAGFGGPCQTTNPGQPVVLYDQVADRWLVSQATTVGPPYYFCVAVSVTGDPTGSYYRWSFNVGDDAHESPRYAVWPDAYYVSAKVIATSPFFTGIEAYALNREDMIAGDPSPGVISFLMPHDDTAYNLGDGLQPADLDGARLPPAGSPGYFVGSMDQGGPYGAPQDALTLWRFHADFATPTNSSFTLASTLPVATFDSIYPCSGQRRCIPQPGASVTQYLDIVSYRQRLLNRLAYRNFGTHEALVANQSVEAATSLAGIRWYEVRDPGGTPVVFQQGTYAPGTFDGIHRWNGSITMDGTGNMALGYSASNATSVFPSVYYTGRLSTDPLGTMPQGEGVFVSGGGIQSSTTNRWGNDSAMNVDPSDDCTFWYVNEYYPVTSGAGWVLRVGTFKYPSCTPAVGVDDDAPPPSATRLSPIGSARARVDVRFTLAASESRRVQLEVMDVSGRRVRRLMDEHLTGGVYHVEWDRTSDTGERLRPGVYHVRLRAGHEQDTEGVILLQ